jgi:hypothetical protein
LAGGEDALQQSWEVLEFEGYAHII